MALTNSPDSNRALSDAVALVTASMAGEHDLLVERLVPEMLGQDHSQVPTPEQRKAFFLVTSMVALTTALIRTMKVGIEPESTLRDLGRIQQSDDRWHARGEHEPGAEDSTS